MNININGIRPTKIINTYNDNKVRVAKSTNIEKSDSVQISDEARNLSKISNDNRIGNSPEKIENIKNQIAQGTYRPNERVVAQKMLDIIKGREI